MRPVPPKPTSPTKSVRLVEPEDRVLLRKPHPCGSFEWRVTRVGADIGLKCAGCGRRVMLAREEFERRARAVMNEDGSSADPWAVENAEPSTEVS
jgi:hypothetical protein